MAKTRKQKQKGKKKQRWKKTPEQLQRKMENRQLEDKIQEAKNRQKFIATLDPHSAEFARREFAKMGLF